MRRISRRKICKYFLHVLWGGMASLLGIPNCFCREESHQKSHQNMKDQNADTSYIPGYVDLHKRGELTKRGEALWTRMESCDLCPRECGAARLAGERGFCEANAKLEIASYNPHYGEEEPLVGRGGSGTIFFSNCNLRCVFCINWEISQGGEGLRRTLEELARIMLYLQKIGCSNINIVTPTHYSPHIIKALDIAAAEGLQIPLVYNTCGWEKVDVLKILAGIVDIYLPDFKYFDSKMANKYSSGADTYSEITRKALLEMNRQVGTAKPAENGLIKRGLMIRHLVMPNHVSGTKEVVEWIAENLPKDTYVNLMSQYRPMYKSFEYPEIARRLHRDEYMNAITWAENAGLTNLEIQGWMRF